MDILYLMILCSVSLAAVFLVVFIIFARKGQFEDDESPAVRILFDSDEIKEKKDEQGDHQNEIEKDNIKEKSE
ncbi:cytochrome oxidase maturation protein, cbb3-type [Chryseobacterium piscicola]|jgi:cbb3-type cytochrome oxidase maturation protein|uniref:Cytochrome oxidase maturation protein, cbb3-type n=1 Tax=Chryseobacterium piscicola TaxID=551459 RepID=A0A1N7KAW6_9FLAO|nr:cbb3-type cytochrome oxidase assembly protein CcoS [Chryseobacterium piscicola]PQA96408.1 cytochrome oxidase maturation protein, cbb3-type [Chryseobacterium piscicola]SIS58702.1 cytochrome oxidase maturation protein, cbb3-type [Chryseobacterium piscicola]